jgi:hypothetical protein
MASVEYAGQKMNCHYQLYGLTIQSAFPLPGAPKLNLSPPSFDVNLSWKPETEWQPDRWLITQASLDSSRPEFGQANDGSVYLAWGDELRVVINAQRDDVCVVSRIAKLEYAPTVIVGFVLGYLLHLRGQLCLHGTLLGLGERTIAILGDSGAGKSTIAAALIKNGAQLLSDDLIALSLDEEGVFVHSGCFGLRLTPKSVAALFPEKEDFFAHVPWLNKKLWDFSICVHESLLKERRLDVLYFLESVEQTSDVTLGSPLSISKATQRLISSWYPPENLLLLSQDRLRQIRLVASEVPLRVIRYKKNWDSLTYVLDLVTYPLSKQFI